VHAYLPPALQLLLQFLAAQLLLPLLLKVRNLLLLQLGSGTV
jgi:hypothetical protein